MVVLVTAVLRSAPIMVINMADYRAPLLGYYWILRRAVCWDYGLQAVAGVSGCANAAAAGGNCGRGAGSALIGKGGGEYGSLGQFAAGCASSVNMGDSCGSGTLDAGVSMAATYLAGGAFSRVEAAAWAQSQHEMVRDTKCAAGPFALLALPSAGLTIGNWIIGVGVFSDW